MNFNFPIKFHGRNAQFFIATLIGISAAQMPVAHADASALFIASALQREAPANTGISRSEPESASSSLDAVSQFIQCCLIGASPRPGPAEIKAEAGNDGMTASDRFVRDVLIRR